MQRTFGIAWMPALALVSLAVAGACSDATSPSGSPSAVAAAAPKNPRGGPKKDVTPPSDPQNLAATVVSASRIDLSWSASTDDKGVTGYRVYRNGALAGTTSGTQFSNTGLAPSTTYSYGVAAYDAAGNTSAVSGSVSATTPAAPVGGGTGTGDPVVGQQVFLAECSTCHTSQDGHDLRFFPYTESDVIRRAEPHIGTAAALDVAAYLKTLNVPDAAPTVLTRIYQPGGILLASDQEFAIRLFGQDSWPEFASFGTAKLRALQASEVPIALPMPLWSDESSNLDWMPDSPFPMVLSWASAGKLSSYYQQRTMSALASAVADLTYVLENGTGPCVGGNQSVKPLECFEARRWVASLAGQHLIRTGLPKIMPASVTKTWWSLGYAVRQAKLAGQPIANQDMNWASWMYFGWMLELDSQPFSHNIVYMGEPFVRLGLQRHMTWVALRDAADRPKGDRAAYEFVNYATEFSLPGDWTYRATAWGFNHLLERLNSGDVPADKTGAQHWVRDRALKAAQPKVTSAQFAVLQDLANRIIAKLQ